MIVLHCMLSQVRGPFCSARLMAHFSCAVGEDGGDAAGTERNQSSGRNDGEETLPASECGKERRRKQGVPQVLVLRGGFQGWYARYREEIGMVEPCE